MRLQVRLVISFLVATGITAAVASGVGFIMMKKSTIDEAQRKVQQDINTAKLVYRHSLERLEYQLQFISVRSPIHEAITRNRLDVLDELKPLIRSDTSTPSGHMAFDMLTLVDTSGRVIYRVANPEAKGDIILWDSVVKKCLQEKRPVSAPVVMPYEVIVAQNPALAQRVKIPIVKTEKSVEISQNMLTDGMVLRSAYPIVDRGGRLLGALVAGILLNKDYTIVDTIKDTVYQAERYHGKDMGFSTLFLGGVRIATNVMTSDNRRAVGTIVSKEVFERVIGQGKEWFGRAFVVNDWYISAYTPIRDIDGNVIGMLYTGILEAKYRDMMMRTVLIFLLVTATGMIIAFFLSFRLGQSIVERIRILKRATEAIASGDLDYQLPSGDSSGFDMLDEAFNTMARSLKERDERLQKAFQRITITERLASLGQMAAGVAHEINNPLGGILLYSNLVMEDMKPGDPSRQNMEKIIYQTERCKKIVQNLLDFARAPSGDMLPLAVNDVITTSLNLVKDQSIFHGIEVKTELAQDLPPVLGDASRLEEVFLNLFINAADAMNGRGRLTIVSRMSTSGMIKVTVSDTGKGIDRAYLPHIFEPFFTTKDPGQGTGLGLSITYGIIQQHGGMIDVESEPGKGTTFIISLPQAEAGSTRAGTEEGAAIG